MLIKKYWKIVLLFGWTLLNFGGRRVGGRTDGRMRAWSCCTPRCVIFFFFFLPTSFCPIPRMPACSSDCLSARLGRPLLPPPPMIVRTEAMNPAHSLALWPPKVTETAAAGQGVWKHDKFEVWAVRWYRVMKDNCRRVERFFPNRIF